MGKKALITGVTGQDGSYLAEFLLERGYEVHGVIRRSSSFNTGRINHIPFDPHETKAHLRLHFGDMTDSGSVHSLIARIQPDEIYNLAAQSHVRVSFDQPIYTSEVVAIGTANLLEAIRQIELPTRFYQAGSSEMFGAATPPQNETTPFKPRSPYACAKVFAHHLTVNYREAYNIFACNGILFNHESPRRGETFVTRKVTRGVTRISVGLQEKLYLGNLAAKRDWGYAPDYVQVMWLMLQQNQPDDYVIATGETHPVQEFVEKAFSLLGLDWQEHVEVDPRYFRPTEVDVLQGDASKAREKLGWKPSVTFAQLVEIMVNEDLQLAKEEQAAAQVRGRQTPV